MEDLFPLLIFIVIVIVNVLKAVAEKKARKPPTKVPQSGQQPPRQSPSTLEEFFEEIARKFEPQPTELPEWPENIKRPDYMREMKDYKTDELYKAEEPLPPPPEPEPAPMPPVTMPVVMADIAQPRAMGKASTFKIPAQGAVFAGLGNMRISMPPMLRSATGSTDFKLETRQQLKKALIASMIFGAPRAYDSSFDNTIAN